MTTTISFGRTAPSIVTRGEASVASKKYGTYYTTDRAETD